jgi:hypothetical protein
MDRTNVLLLDRNYTNIDFIQLLVVAGALILVSIISFKRRLLALARKFVTAAAPKVLRAWAICRYLFSFATLLATSFKIPSFTLLIPRRFPQPPFPRPKKPIPRVPTPGFIRSSHTRVFERCYRIRYCRYWRKDYSSRGWSNLQWILSYRARVW